MNYESPARNQNDLGDEPARKRARTKDDATPNEDGDEDISLFKQECLYTAFLQDVEKWDAFEMDDNTAHTPDTIMSKDMGRHIRRIMARWSHTFILERYLAERRERQGPLTLYQAAYLLAEICNAERRDQEDLKTKAAYFSKKTALLQIAWSHVYVTHGKASKARLSKLLCLLIRYLYNRFNARFGFQPSRELVRTYTWFWRFLRPFFPKGWSSNQPCDFKFCLETIWCGETAIAKKTLPATSSIFREGFQIDLIVRNAIWGDNLEAIQWVLRDLGKQLPRLRAVDSLCEIVRHDRFEIFQWLLRQGHIDPNAEFTTEKHSLASMASGRCLAWLLSRNQAGVITRSLGLHIVNRLELDTEPFTLHHFRSDGDCTPVYTVDLKGRNLCNESCKLLENALVRRNYIFKWIDLRNNPRIGYPGLECVLRAYRVRCKYDSSVYEPFELRLPCPNIRCFNLIRKEKSDLEDRLIYDNLVGVDPIDHLFVHSFPSLMNLAAYALVKEQIGSLRCIGDPGAKTARYFWQWTLRPGAPPVSITEPAFFTLRDQIDAASPPTPTTTTTEQHV